MACITQPQGESSHGAEKTDHLLYVMHRIVGLLTHFHEQIGYRGISGGEPAVVPVELVAQYKA